MTRTGGNCRRALLSAGAALMIAVPAGCADADTNPQSHQLKFEYRAHTGDGRIDQTMVIVNTTDNTVAPTVGYTAVDASGNELSTVVVTTVYGSDSGRLLIPSLGATIDILMFDGEGRSEVADVVAVVQVQRVTGSHIDPTNADVEITPFAADGGEVTKFDPFATIQVTNPHTADVNVRVVCLQYDQPAEGESQQVTEVLQLVERAELPGATTTELELPTDVATELADRGYGCASLKAHLTP